MKRRVLLIDDSLTVQKVVSLTLDKQLYDVYYAKSRGEVAKTLGQVPMDILLLSTSVADMDVSNFWRELESWVPASYRQPPTILVVREGDEISESVRRNCVAVLSKPFSPSTLLSLIQANVTQAVTTEDSTPTAAPLENTFNDAFSDEAALVNQTINQVSQDYGSSPGQSALESQGEPAPLWDMESVAEQPVVSTQSAATNAPLAGNSLWEAAPAAQATATSNSVINEEPEMELQRGKKMESSLLGMENKMKDTLDPQQLEQVLSRVLKQIVPPIVERLVKERLDSLLQEQENVAK